MKLIIKNQKIFIVLMILSLCFVSASQVEASSRQNAVRAASAAVTFLQGQLNLDAIAVNIFGRMSDSYPKQTMSLEEYNAYTQINNFFSSERKYYIKNTKSGKVAYIILGGKKDTKSAVKITFGEGNLIAKIDMFERITDAEKKRIESKN